MSTPWKPTRDKEVAKLSPKEGDWVLERGETPTSRTRGGGTGRACASRRLPGESSSSSDSDLDSVFSLSDDDYSSSEEEEEAKWKKVKPAAARVIVEPHPFDGFG